MDYFLLLDFIVSGQYSKRKRHTAEWRYSMKRILLLATGGTIATKKTDQGLTPQLTSRELLDAIRLQLAKERIQAYLQGMKVLGYTEEEAKALLLKEE